jgi:hypothetical protein
MEVCVSVHVCMHQGHYSVRLQRMHVASVALSFVEIHGHKFRLLVVTCVRVTAVDMSLQLCIEV